MCICKCMCVCVCVYNISAEGRVHASAFWLIKHYLNHINGIEWRGPKRKREKVDPWQTGNHSRQGDGESECVGANKIRIRAEDDSTSGT